MSIHSTGLSDDERRLVVSPKGAAEMLDIGITRVYELLKNDELTSFKDGSARKITVDSIRAYVARRLQQAQANPGANQPKPLPPQLRKRGAAASPMEETA